MVNWYAVIDTASGSVLAYTSDDVPNYQNVKGSMHLQGPYATQQAAQQALQPQIASANSVLIANLQVKPSGNWTMQDVADWCKAKG